MSTEHIGTDEWVAQHKERSSAPSGLRELVYEYGERLPLSARFTLLIGLGLLVALITDNPYILRVAGTIALMSTLALGLNVVVGYAGLLDLGFVAFYGIGAYAYAYLSSDFSGVHLPTWGSLLIIIALGIIFGFLLGLPSLRLVGDYLAIVTLGFGQIFVQLATSLTRVSVPWAERPVNLTGGPNGIINLDPISFFGFTARSILDHYYILLGVLAVILLFVFHLNNSRIGRAWRSMREDELAAEAMGMPTRRLKLQAFAIGAAIAALSGALFAGWQGSVFPGNFDVTLLITLYAIIVLGGMGSLPGVLIGGIIMIAMPEVLRNIELAGTLFYVGALLTLYAVLKPRWQMPLLLVAVAASGLIFKAALLAISPEALVSSPAAAGSFIGRVRDWLAIPGDAVHYGNLAFVALIVFVLGVSRIKRNVPRFLVLIPALYLAAFVWETRLSAEPSITRLLIVGVMLVVLMINRPQGLLGQPRVEVI